MIFDRWLTVDVDPRSDAYVDIRKPLPFAPESIDVIYCEEAIEHIERPLGFQLLSQCFRILKPGGCLRLTTPSLDFFVNRSFDDLNAAAEINAIFYGHGHRYIYSEAEIRSFLRIVGYHEVQKSTYRDKSSRFGYFDTHPIRHPGAPPESSQFWEAVKQ